MILNLQILNSFYNNLNHILNCYKIKLKISKKLNLEFKFNYLTN